MHLLISAFAALLLTALAPSAPPEACYFAQVGVIVDDVADFKYQRVVVTRIRRLEPAADASPGNCVPRNRKVVAAMRRAVEQQLDSVVVPPRVRATIDFQHASIDVVRNEIKKLAIRAREHAGAFTRLEVVNVDESIAPRSGELPLPKLAPDSAAAAACSKDNAALERSAAKYRWAC